MLRLTTIFFWHENIIWWDITSTNLTFLHSDSAPKFSSTITTKVASLWMNRLNLSLPGPVSWPPRAPPTRSASSATSAWRPPAAVVQTRPQRMRRWRPWAVWRSSWPSRGGPSSARGSPDSWPGKKDGILGWWDYKVVQLKWELKMQLISFFQSSQFYLNKLE